MHNQKCGFIHLITGCMFSGKTTELFRLCKRQLLAGKSVILVKSIKDTRDGNLLISTHDKTEMCAIATEKLFTVYKQIQSYDVVGIDEGQFFTDVEEFADKLANDGKLIYIAALDGDYTRKPFPSIALLIPKSDYLTKLNAVCKNCGNTAAFSYRKTTEKEIELVGGSAVYTALCRLCFLVKKG